MRLRSIAAAVGLGLVLGPVAAAAQTVDLDRRIVRIVEQVSEARLEGLLRRLEGFETRHTLSATDDPARGIGAARQWMLDELQRTGPRLQVTFDSYRIPPQEERITRDVDLRNVMAVLPGRSGRRIYVSAHYDTVARLPETDRFDWHQGDNFAPGVNDDGSGTALTMELARVFAQSGVEFDATLVFIAFAGEEQGLVGARLHAQAARRTGVRIDAVFNNDIVGGEVGGSGIADSSGIRVFSEGPEDSPSRQLARFLRRHAARYVPGHRVRLIARHDRFGRGGDHTAFNQQGYAAVRLTEARENYRRQHTVHDTMEGISVPYLANNARVNAAALAVLALAPPAPEIAEDGRPLLGRGPSGYDADLQWHPSPGAAGYRIFWREAWTPDWQHELAVGPVTRHVLPDLSIDDYVFGVAAVGPGGHESLVSVYVYPPRPAREVQTVRVGPEP